MSLERGSAGMKNGNHRLVGILSTRRHPWRIFSRRLTARRDRGATAAEYAIVLALISGAIVAAVSTFGQAVAGLFNSAATGW